MSRLFKSHALGNDYLILEQGPTPSLAQVRGLCDRTRGFGSDGLLLPAPPQGADYGLRIFNPDGSEAEKSGNGLRIFARWLHDHRGAPESFTVHTLGGVVTCRVQLDAVEVDMGHASFAPTDLPMLCADPEFIESPLLLGQGPVRATALSVGNPHCVVFTDQDLDSQPWRDLGRQLEQHPAFPKRVNFQLARVRGPGQLELRIWERGAGETSASGSSSRAVAADAVRTGRCDPGEITLTMPGGVLTVDVGRDWSLRLRGPVTPIGVLLPDPQWLATLG